MTPYQVLCTSSSTTIYPQTWANQSQLPSTSDSSADPPSTAHPVENTMPPRALEDTPTDNANGRPTTKRNNEAQRKRRVTAKFALLKEAAPPQLNELNDRRPADEIRAVRKQRMQVGVVNNTKEERRIIEEKRIVQEQHGIDATSIEAGNIA
jgi:hypothetical protein